MKYDTLDSKFWKLDKVRICITKLVDKTMKEQWYIFLRLSFCLFVIISNIIDIKLHKVNALCKIATLLTHTEQKIKIYNDSYKIEGNTDKQGNVKIFRRKNNTIFKFIDTSTP